MKHMRLSNLKGKRHRYPVPARSGREPLGEPMFEEEAGNGDTGISAPSLARAMTKDGKLQNWVVDTWTKQKPEKLVHGTNMVHVRTLNGLSQSGYGCAKRRVSCADPR